MYTLGTKLCLYLLLLTHDVSLGGKVLGGREAVQGEFPFAVRIGGGSACGGSLVTFKKIVSAAHCFVTYGPGGKKEVRDLTITYVIAGTIYFKEQTGGHQQRSIIKYILAKGAGPKKSGGMYYDVSLSELDKPFDPSDTVKLMTIATTDPIKFKQSWDELVTSGKKCMSIGWGTTVVIEKSGQVKTEVLSDVLKVVELVPWPDESCSETVWPEDKDTTKEGHVCCSPVNTGESVLPGDSGGPLICSGNVWGVLSSVNVKNAKTNATAQFMLLFKHMEEFNLTEATIGTGAALKLIPTPLIIYSAMLLSL